MKSTFAKLALTTLFATGLATAAWAWGADVGGYGDDCCGTAAGKHRMPSGKRTNISLKPRATAAAKPKAAAPVRPARTAPPRKRVNFTTKRKR